MELYLMQHGEALAKEVDPERGLSPEGEKQVRISGEALAKLGVRLENVACSTKKRARQTAQAVAEAMGPPGGEIRVLEALEPLVPPEETIAAIESLDVAGPLLLAGHLPSLAEVAAYLMDCQRRIAFRMGGVACLQVEGWRRGGAVLMWCLTPEHFRRIAG